MVPQPMEHARPGGGGGGGDLANGWLNCEKSRKSNRNLRFTVAGLLNLLNEFCKVWIHLDQSACTYVPIVLL